MSLDFLDTIEPLDLRTPQSSPLPESIMLGTSTWAFPGWKGVVYTGEYKSERDFNLRCLEEYATIPWFRTMCIDSLFYNPPSLSTLERYANQTPEYFRWVSKAWERITIHTYPRHARYGELAGKKNPDFLNIEMFKQRVLSVFDSTPAIRNRTGPFVFQFAPFSSQSLAYPEFIDRLAVFLRNLPTNFAYAVEIRNKELLTKSYFQALNEARVAHCFNHWNSMVGLRAQMKAAAEAGGLAADFYVGRLLTPLGISYEAAEKIFEPYDAVTRVNQQMRADVVTLAKRALATNKRAFITANNKAEGNSALTMASIGKLISLAISDHDSADA